MELIVHSERWWWGSSRSIRCCKSKFVCV